MSAATRVDRLGRPIAVGDEIQADEIGADWLRVEALRGDEVLVRLPWISVAPGATIHPYAVRAGACVSRGLGVSPSGIGIEQDPMALKYPSESNPGKCRRVCDDQGDSVICGEPAYRAQLCAAHFENTLLSLNEQISALEVQVRQLIVKREALQQAIVVGDGRQSWHGEPCPKCKRPASRSGQPGSTGVGLPPRARAAVCWGQDTDACVVLRELAEKLRVLSGCPRAEGEG